MIDLIAMLGNISSSFLAVSVTVTGLSYLLGILFFVTAFNKFRKRGLSPHESFSGPMAYLLVGAVLLFLPSSLHVMANTFFGEGNVLAYKDYRGVNLYNIFNSMGILIRTAGVIWFVRGCVLILYANQPGEQKALKGVFFLAAGVFAINFENTGIFLTWVMSQIAAHV